MILVVNDFKKFENIKLQSYRASTTTDSNHKASILKPALSGENPVAAKDGERPDEKSLDPS